MPPLSCSPGCDSCHLFSQKIVELEARISTLLQIKASEEFLDSIIIGSSPHTHTDGCFDSTVPCNTLTPPHTNTTSVPVVSPRLLPRTQPALLTSSTPHQPEPWRVSKHQSRRSGQRSAPAQPLRLENRYSILTNDEEFPSLPRPHAAHPGPSTQSTRPLRADSPPSDSSISTLVIGSSMVRDLHIPPLPSGPSKVYCFPGAKVRDIQHKLPGILARHSKVDNIIVHVGTNNIRERRSIALQEDFTTLITTLMGTGKRIVISGPLPTYRKGAERWSRLFWLHTWLEPLCTSLGLPYVDNFNLFWEMPNLLKRDGLHPNRHGARLLSDNITTTLTEDEIVVVRPGDNAILPCQVADPSINDVEWTRPDKHPSFKKRVRVYLVNRDQKDRDVSLTLENVSRHDAGTYECRVSSGRSKLQKIDSEPIRTILLQVTERADKIVVNNETDDRNGTKEDIESDPLINIDHLSAGYRASRSGEDRNSSHVV